MNLTPEILFVIFAIVFGVACNGAIKLFYKYNTLLVIAYIVFLFPIALAHSLLIGLFGDNRKQILVKKVKEQAKFEKMVEKEKEIL